MGLCATACCLYYSVLRQRVLVVWRCDILCSIFVVSVVLFISVSSLCLSPICNPLAHPSVHLCASAASVPCIVLSFLFSAIRTTQARTLGLFGAAIVVVMPGMRTNTCAWRRKFANVARSSTLALRGRSVLMRRSKPPASAIVVRPLDLCSLREALVRVPTVTSNVSLLSPYSGFSGYPSAPSQWSSQGAPPTLQTLQAGVAQAPQLDCSQRSPCARRASGGRAPQRRRAGLSIGGSQACSLVPLPERDLARHPVGPTGAMFLFGERLDSHDVNLPAPIACAIRGEARPHTCGEAQHARS